MCFKRGVISILSDEHLKLEDKFTYLGSSVSSTECDVNIHQAKVWTAIDWLSIIWKWDQSDKIKRDFFQAVAVSILLYRCTTWAQTKCTEKKVDRNYTRMQRAILNKFWKQHATKQLYGYTPSSAVYFRSITDTVDASIRTLFWLTGVQTGLVFSYSAAQSCPTLTKLWFSLFLSVPVSCCRW